MKTRSTKQQLLLSFVALLLCVSMFVGSTFAWFTDSVTSTNNVIKSGTLDITFEWMEGKQNPATDSTEWIDASTGPIFNSTLWEPGYTAVRHIKIANEGTLALKYQLSIIPEGDVSELSDVIDVYYIDPAMQVNDRTELPAANKLGTLTQVLGSLPSSANGKLEAGDEEIITLALKMQETAGNEYQNKQIGDKFSVMLFATQVEHEDDSFDDLYDAEAPITNKVYANVSDAGLAGLDVTVDDKNGANVGSVTIPTEALADDTDVVAVTIEETVFSGNFTIAADEAVKAFDVSVTGLKDNNNAELTVTLRIDPMKDPATVKLYHYDELIPSTYYPQTGYVTFKTKTFSPFTVVYKADSQYVAPEAGVEGLPTATVVTSPEYVNTELPWGSYGQWSPTEGLDANLEAAYTFACAQTVEEAEASPFAYWYCDFFVKLDRDLGANEIFLGGNYGLFGWVGFHNGDFTLGANEEIPLLGSVASNSWTYLDVVQNVGTFICGVGDVDNALDGATFTVMLRLTNPKNEAEFYNVAVINHKFGA